MSGWKQVTDRQREVLAFIHKSITSRGGPPTLRMIGERFGIASTNGVTEHVRALIRRGYLERDGLKTAKAIRITDAGFALLQEPTPDEMRAAIGRAARQRGLLIRCWSLLTQVAPVSPLLQEVREELGIDERLVLTGDAPNGTSGTEVPK